MVSILKSFESGRILVASTELLVPTVCEVAQVPNIVVERIGQGYSSQYSDEVLSKIKGVASKDVPVAEFLRWFNKAKHNEDHVLAGINDWTQSTLGSSVAKRQKQLNQLKCYDYFAYYENGVLQSTQIGSLRRVYVKDENKHKYVIIHPSGIEFIIPEYVHKVMRKRHEIEEELQLVFEKAPKCTTHS